MISKNTDKPNIIFILTDDQGQWALGCYGNNEIRTPNLDRLSSNGIKFENFFCASPVCSPARGTILTGRMPSCHGIHDWIRIGNFVSKYQNPHGKEKDHPINYLEGIPTYSEILAEAGYVCGLSGKWHLGNSIKKQKGFSYWYVAPYGAQNYYDALMVNNGKVSEEPGYMTDNITNAALEFIKDNSKDKKPFYLSVHYTAPHSPWHYGCHPKEVVDSYNDCPFETCPEEPLLHPWQQATCPRGTREKRKELLKGYFASITKVDEGVGLILDLLDKLNLRENTLIIFTSDNGMNMGHHGVWGKGNGTFPLNMYDTSVKVPLIISKPGGVPEGKVCSEMLSQYDFLPTILDYAGLKKYTPGNLPGKSFIPVLEGKKIKSRDNVVVYDEYGPVRMIRNKEWKYVHRYPYGPNELYNLKNDPNEEHNLVNETDKAKIIKEMKRELEEWFDKYTDPDLDGRFQSVYGKGQMNFVGRRSKGEKAFGDDWCYIDENARSKI